MTEQPQPMPPRLIPVPAMPITVMLHRKGECCVVAAGRTFTASTLREAVASAAAIGTSLAGKEKDE